MENCGRNESKSRQQVDSRKPMTISGTGFEENGLLPRDYNNFSTNYNGAESFLKI
jgi:hypothetical protein